MILIPLVNSCNLSLQFIIKLLALVKTLLDKGLFEILIVEVIDLSLVLLYQVFHPVERLDVPDTLLKNKFTYFLLIYFMTVSGSTKLERASQFSMKSY